MKATATKKIQGSDSPVVYTLNDPRRVVLIDTTLPTNGK
jgi:hypothetical protein